MSAHLRIIEEHEVWCGACDRIFGPYATAEAAEDAMNGHALGAHAERVRNGPGFAAEVRVAGTTCRCNAGEGRCGKCQ